LLLNSDSYINGSVESNAPASRVKIIRDHVPVAARRGADLIVSVCTYARPNAGATFYRTYINEIFI